MANPVVAARAWMTSFKCHLPSAHALIPPPLQPVALRGDKALLQAFVLDCDDSPFGAFRYFGVGVAVRHRSLLSLPFSSLWGERKSSDYGFWNVLSIASTEQATEALNEKWGLPAVQLDIDVSAKRSKMKTLVSEGRHEVLRFQMKRPGAGMPLHFPWRLYGRDSDELLMTEMTVDAVGREKRMLVSSSLVLHRHEAAEVLRTLAIEGKKPLEVRWYDSFHTRLDDPNLRFRAK